MPGGERGVVGLWVSVRVSVSVVTEGVALGADGVRVGVSSAKTRVGFAWEDSQGNNGCGFGVGGPGAACDCWLFEVSEYDDGGWKRADEDDMVYVMVGKSAASGRDANGGG